MDSIDRMYLVQTRFIFVYLGLFGMLIASYPHPEAGQRSIKNIFLFLVMVCDPVL